MLVIIIDVCHSHLIYFFCYARACFMVFAAPCYAITVYAMALFVTSRSSPVKWIFKNQAVFWHGGQK